ncbi:MAG: hypothetical protein PHH47_07420 [Gallionella sp.]|nr:hypothetical protein [Gallionella sp.]MDD4945382.1 hypothetical protein [Gallionella sp.]
MAGEMERLFALAGRVYVLLRREKDRMIDVEWLSLDVVYALEVINIARGTNHPELLELAERIEEIHPLLANTTKAIAVSEIAPPSEKKYVKTLR